MRIETEKCEFGFLYEPVNWDTDEFSVYTLESFEDDSRWVSDNSNNDGYFYPPPYAEYELDPITLERVKKVERSQRPARVYHLPATHSVRVKDSFSGDDPVTSDEALIVYLIAFLYGTRLIFKEWRFEGRVPIEKKNSLLFHERTGSHFVDHVYRWWRLQPLKSRTALINVLYLHTRTNSVESQWEAFSQHYMVFDALFNLFKVTNKVDTPVPHRKRMEFICKYYDIEICTDTIEQLCNIRNELFHEALWNGTVIGMSLKEYQTINVLSRLNERLICNIPGYKSNFASSSISAMGWQSFDKYEC